MKWLNKINSFKKELRRHGFYPVRNGNPSAPIFFKHTIELGGLYANIDEENTSIQVNDVKRSFSFESQRDLKKFLNGVEDEFAKFQFSRVLSRKLINDILEQVLQST